MIRKSFVMSVDRGMEEEYEVRHNPIWDDLKATLKDHGVHNYSIFIDIETNVLFGYVEIESEELWNAISETDSCRKWWHYMKDVMPCNSDSSPISSELKEVFHLD